MTELYIHNGAIYALSWSCQERKYTHEYLLRPFANDTLQKIKSLSLQPPSPRPSLHHRSKSMFFPRDFGHSTAHTSVVQVTPDSTQSAPSCQQGHERYTSAENPTRYSAPDQPAQGAGLDFLTRDRWLKGLCRTRSA